MDRTSSFARTLGQAAAAQAGLNALRWSEAFGSPYQEAIRNLKMYGNAFESRSALHRAAAVAVTATAGSRWAFAGTSPWAGQLGLLKELDLRQLMPGTALIRTDALKLAYDTNLWLTLTNGLERLDPENWRGEDLDRVAMLSVMEDGIPLVWTPDADVIKALTAEQEAAVRRKVLEQHAPAVTSHCLNVLDAVKREDLAPQVGYLQDCLEILSAGTFAPAQALAANVFDTVLRAMVRADPTLLGKSKYFKYSEVTANLPKATLETTVGRFRAYCVHTCVHVACIDYYGPPVPPRHSRHATSHATGRTQYTVANALAAVMLAVGLLRELEETGRPITLAE
jgi:hypothetical protein